VSNDASRAKPKWFTPVAWLLFVWNLLGLMAFVMQVTMSPEQLAALPEAERALFESYAIWGTIAFAVAVIGGTIGSLLLALGRALALPILVVSLAGVLVQKLHDSVFVDVVAVYGSAPVVMSAFVIAISVLLIFMARKGIANQWLS